MDVHALPFDRDAALDRLRRWVERESPTFDRDAVDAMMDVAATDLADLGATLTRVPGRMGFADCLLARLPHPRSGEPGILVLGHLDTVHPVGTLGTLPFRVEGTRCYGPGILDMKGGCRAALEAIGALRRTGAETSLPVTVLFTSDEEVGSPSTRALIEAEAARHRFVLVPEPALGEGGVITGRYAIARFDLTATGRPSHAGQALGEGRSAIRVMAEKIIEIEAMTTDDCTFSVGTVNGGRWVNCVPTSCSAEALSMAKRQADLDRGVERMLATSFARDGAAIHVELGVVRPVWSPDASTFSLYETARTIALRLGSKLEHGSSGGGSDANFTGALGIPTLDGLGLTGACLHTLEEHIEIESLEARTRMIAGLLAALH